MNPIDFLFPVKVLFFMGGVLCSFAARDAWERGSIKDAVIFSLPMATCFTFFSLL